MTISPWLRWGGVLGFAMGGFFDGVLLHQILQWHHLLSLAPGMADLRAQVLWDGYFHALMYLIAAAGLWGLWRASRAEPPPPGRRLAGALAAGFGVWHLVDGVLSHWVLGIHRIKLDSPQPLLWDLVWFAAFGLAPLGLGWILLRRGGPPVGAKGSTLALLALGALTGLAGGWSAAPPAAQPFTTVVFRPGMGQAEVLAALASADGRLVWTDAAMGVVVAQIAPGRRLPLYGQGALLVSGSGAPAGCAGWVRAPPDAAGIRRA